MSKRKIAALALLMAYLDDDSDETDGSSEEETEEVAQDEKTEAEVTPKRARKHYDEPKEQPECQVLPLPKGILNMFSDDKDESNASSSSSDGRIRSFEHFPGNWALHVYATFPGTSDLEAIIDAVVNSLPLSVSSSMHMFPINDLHVSLSRTVPIRHYWIEPITEQLKEALSLKQRFDCIIDRPQLYVNDEKTRSFLGLKIFTGEDKLQDLTSVVDNIFDGFSLPKYYENPSFHVSIAWCLGDIFTQICKKDEEKLQTAAESAMTNKSLSFDVKEVKCKIGNKLFSYSLNK